MDYARQTGRSPVFLVVFCLFLHLQRIAFNATILHLYIEFEKTIDIIASSISYLVKLPALESKFNLHNMKFDSFSEKHYFSIGCNLWPACLRSMVSYHRSLCFSVVLYLSNARTVQKAEKYICVLMRTGPLSALGCSDTHSTCHCGLPSRISIWAVISAVIRCHDHWCTLF